MHSPLVEVAICMSIYSMIPQAIENIAPVLERLWYFDSRLRPGVESIERKLHYFFPWIIAAAYLLPGMHQSSLGALMLLAGERVHPLWQTPWLPDILFRGALGTAFRFDRFGAVFWVETALVSIGGILLRRSVRKHELQPMFIGYILSSLGGMIYRFSPTTLAFRPNPQALYFPATIEVLVSLGFISLGIVGFLIAVKRLAILPAPLTEWHDMASYFRFRRPYIRWTGYFKYGHFGEDETKTS